MLYLSMCLAFLLIHLDDGILSVASEHIIHDLNFTEADLGLIEAAVYLGITLGCLLCPLLYAKLNPKFLVLFGVLTTSCCVSSWVFFNSFWLLATFRFLNGIFLVSTRNYFRWDGENFFFRYTYFWIFLESVNHLLPCMDRRVSPNAHRSDHVDSGILPLWTAGSGDWASRAHTHCETPRRKWCVEVQLFGGAHFTHRCRRHGIHSYTY